MIDFFSFLKNPKIKLSVKLFSKTQNHNQSQIISNSGNNPTFSLINNQELEPYILTENSGPEKLVKLGLLDESQKPWRFSRSNIGRIRTKYVKYGSMWLVSNKK
ncbi:MAG: hypothetical protein FJ368_00670 [Pelagibacterales bacterium]|nr:hypothetical protein [Pelagibacterales bacterium]